MHMWRIAISIFVIVVLTACQEPEVTKETTNEEIGSDITGIEEKAVEEKEEGQQTKTSSITPMTTKNDKPIIRDQREGIKPTTISIPSIKVEANIEDVGLLDNGQMGVPEDFNQVGWFKEGIMPGEQGNAVLAGHVDSKTGPAIFYRLDQLSVGDEVTVQDENGKTLTFVVYDKKSFETETAPVQKIFGFSYRSQLNLITCTGSFNREKGTHEERLVVYTVLKT